jgi:hypothetical protein
MRTMPRYDLFDPSLPRQILQQVCLGKYRVIPHYPQILDDTEEIQEENPRFEQMIMGCRIVIMEN